MFEAWANGVSILRLCKEETNLVLNSIPNLWGCSVCRYASCIRNIFNLLSSFSFSICVIFYFLVITTRNCVFLQNARMFVNHYFSLHICVGEDVPTPVFQGPLQTDKYHLTTCMVPTSRATASPVTSPRTNESCFLTLTAQLPQNDKHKGTLEEEKNVPLM